MYHHTCQSLTSPHACTRPHKQACHTHAAPSVLDCPLLIDLPCETHTTVLLSFPFSPTSLPINPLPPPCASLLTLSPCIPSPHTENDQPSLVWFDRGKFYLTFEGKLSLHRLACTHTLLKLICASAPSLAWPCPLLSIPPSQSPPSLHPCLLLAVPPLSNPTLQPGFLLQRSLDCSF